MALKHIIMATDTLQYLAQFYYNDPTKWKTIADYNKLDYPYITDINNYNELLKASGYVKCARIKADEDLIIKKGIQFGTTPSAFSPETKIYETKEDYFIPAGVYEFSLWVYCTVPGSFGNVLPGMITTVVSPEYKNIIWTVTNEDAITNGADLNIKTTGDIIFIPVNDKKPTVTEEDYLDQLGGEDLSLAIDGDLIIDSFGDLGSVKGLTNIKEAIKHRLCTERGELIMHDEYGTTLAELIGKPQVYIQKLMELAIIEALQYEDRIEEVTILNIQHDATSIWVDLEIKLLNSSEVEIIRGLSITRGGV